MENGHFAFWSPLWGIWDNVTDAFYPSEAQWSGDSGLVSASSVAESYQQ